MSAALAVVGAEYEPEKPRVTKTTKYYNLVELDGHILVDASKAPRDEVKRCLWGMMTDSVGHSTARVFNHRYPLSTLAKYPDRARYYLEDYAYPEVAELMELIIDYGDTLKREVQERVDSGKVEYDDLAILFEKGARVVGDNGSVEIAGWVEDTEYTSSFFGSYCTVKIRVVHNGTGNLAHGVYDLTVPAFSGLKSIAELPVKLLDEATGKALTKRGRDILRHLKSGSYARYNGELVQPGWWSTRRYRATGRAVIDPASFAQVNPETYRDAQRAMPETEKHKKDNGKDIIVSDDDLFAVFPFTLGFSFVAKQWGVMRADQIEPINWREDSFEKLVLPDEEKSLIRALVEHHGGSFEDIIDGKGGGCIFLLHGEPGQGKTLTAEAVAELLHRPLYSISVGELGTDPDTLETSLRKILDVAMTWNAVILLDEADIFLEARDEKDIVRNAMVGVFLRLLEYHQGVMFLTTNRVKQIDRAFYSRISVALKFADAGEEKRQRIWENLLGAAKIEGINVKKMAREHLNGRQIKNTIRLAQTLARSEGVQMTEAHLDRTITIARNFESEMDFSH